jgi:hypothetical protein
MIEVTAPIQMMARHLDRERVKSNNLIDAKAAMNCMNTESIKTIVESGIEKMVWVSVFERSNYTRIQLRLT